jgi:serine/threonine protein kinase
MGTVYRAHDPDLNREVALKLIALPDPTNSGEWRQRFQREVQAAAKLNHPHIVTVHDVGLGHEPPYVVMELLSGETLEERLTAGPLPWQEVLSLLRPLAQALAYAHRIGVVHRDVKPSNVMFTGDEANTLKLVDFGLVRWQGGSKVTQAGTVVGTPAYMSPEQAHNKEVDGRTDIFALGIILFEAIVGRNPLNRSSLFLTLTEVMSDVQIDVSPLVGRAPPEVINLIKQAIVKDRERRYPTCEALLADLDHCLNDLVGFSTVLPGSPRSINESSSNLDIRVASNIELAVEVKAVLRAMFRTFSQIAIEAEFSRGFSGSHVFRGRLIESGGRAHLPAIIKIATVGLIQKEWRAYQTLVEHTLPNIARLEASPMVPTDSLWGGLHYSLVGGGTFGVQSLHDYYREANVDDMCWVLENRLFEVLGPNWWLDNRTDRAYQMQTDYDRLLPVNLLIRPAGLSPGDDIHLVEAGNKQSFSSIPTGGQVELKGFVITEVELKRRQVILNLPPEPEGRLPASYRLRLDSVPDIARYQVGDVFDAVRGEVIATRHDLLVDQASRALGQTVDLSAARLSLSEELSLPNPLLTYQDLLQDFMTVNISTVHGDLNLENILIDPDTREISLIDFATVHQGHALLDLLRLETEVVVMLIPPILAEVGLPPETIFPFYEQLHGVTLHPDRVTSLNLSHTALEKPFKMLLLIRKMARKCLFNLDDWQEYYQGLTLHLLGALKFKRLADLPTAPLPMQTAFWGAATAQHLLEMLLPRQQQRFEKKSISPQIEALFEIEPPYGTMRPGSVFYIERVADEHCQGHIDKPYATTLFIQAPRQMGKSSLMRRTIYGARTGLDKTCAFVDFQRFPGHYFEDEENFLIELCLMIGDALKIPEAIDQYWRGRRTNIIKCSRYLSEYIIPQLNGPFILAMDEVERILTSSFQANFFGMLRTWHNDRVFGEDFARMTLFLSSSTEPYLFIENPHQSPFNVAEVISLQDFTRAEVDELNRRHHSPLSQHQLGNLMDLVNGHPFLTRVALYKVATGKIDMNTLLARATEDTGPFGDHLRHYLLRVLENPALKQALTDICRHHAHEENKIFYRLKGAGLVKKTGQQVILRNNLYTRYFEERLNV